MFLTALFGLFSFGFSTAAFAHSLEALVGTELASDLTAGKRPLVSQFKTPVPQLLPENEFLKSRLELVRLELEPNVMVETLYIYRKPENRPWNEEEKTGLFNAMLAMSTLAGLQYYSASRRSMRTFYETSTVIDNPATRRPLPDPFFQSPPAAFSLYARQRDTTFGDNIYQYDFYFIPGAIIFIQQNLSPLNAGIIRALGRNRLRSVVAILDAGQYILVYAASMARTAALPGMNERIGTSFANRADAVFYWFSSQADGVLR